MGILKSIFTLGAVGAVATLSGTLLLPFFGAAAGGAMGGAALAGTAASNGAVLTSFWSPLFTNPLTGDMGIGEGVSRIFNGLASLGASAYDVASTTAEYMGHGFDFADSLGIAWNSDAPHNPYFGA